jgi:hypothetical protein
MNDWQGQFAQGFTNNGSVDNTWVIGVFFGVVAVLGALWFAYDRYQKYQARQPRKMAKASEEGASGSRTGAKFVPVPGRLNPLQQKLLQELIDEFRRQETAAQAVPSAILEKFAEFFYNNVKRMKTPDKDVEDFVNRNFPLQEGFTVELDLQTSGSLHLVKSKVIEVAGKHIIVEFSSQVPDFLRKGMSLQINYNVGKHFLQGSTVITEVRHDVGVILKKPTEVVLTSERRYNRMILRKATGTLHDPRSEYQTPVKVLDLSLEGVRIQVGRPLDKTRIYQLHFETEDEGKPLAFGPIECAPSKAFLTGSGNYETGLVFLYLDVGTKTRLLQYMKRLVLELQAAAKSSEADSPG